MIMAAALQALARNKMRSALTMLGVFIGVAALIAMVAVGQGANEAVRKQIESLGTNLLVVVPGATTMGGIRSGSGERLDSHRRRCRGTPPRSSSGRQRQLSHPADGAGSIRQSELDDEHSRRQPNYPPITNWQIAAGRGISQEDDSSAALVVVLGQTVFRQLFGANENPIGAVIQVKSVPLRVIGIFASKGQTSFGTGSGRSRHDPVHDRRAQSPRRRRAEPAAGRPSTGSIRRRPILTTFSSE